MNRRTKRIIIIMCIIGVISVISYNLYKYNIIPHTQYTDEDFGIESYQSQADCDDDGIDDQTDLLQNVREYIATNPKYRSEYYDTGYPQGEYGVCTDVVGMGLLGAGYNLMELVNQDMLENMDSYPVDHIDRCIDFRRVRNLDIYFQHHAIVLTTNLHEIDQWHGGDIVVFDGHIGIVSDKRNHNGVPFLIHHASPYQINYEEDVLEQRDDIIGHYRIS